MVPAAVTGKEWFTVPQVARVLGISKQTIYDAVRDGRLAAVGERWDRRLHGQEILKHALRTGRSIDEVSKRMREVKNGELTWQEILGWALLAAGLIVLLTKARDE